MFVTDICGISIGKLPKQRCRRLYEQDLIFVFFPPPKTKWMTVCQGGNYETSALANLVTWSCVSDIRGVAPPGGYFRYVAPYRKRRNREQVYSAAL